MNDKKSLQRDGTGSAWPEDRKEKGVFMGQKEGQLGGLTEYEAMKLSGQKRAKACGPV